MTERRFVDLHTHSLASDGSLRPADLIDAADRAKLAAIALTDHDTVAGLAEARERSELYPELTFIPGIEVSAEFPVGVLHILGLGIDPTCPELLKLTESLRIARLERNPQIITKLQNAGVDVSLEEVFAKADPTGKGESEMIISRVHIAQVLREKGYVKTITQAFQQYLGRGTVGFVEKDHTPPREAIAALRAAGGVACLAHPPQLKYENNAQLERILRELIDAGLGGVECYHSMHTPMQTRTLLDFTRKYKLCVTGGSDFHGQGKPDVMLGHPRTPLSMISPELIARYASK